MGYKIPALISLVLLMVLGGACCSRKANVIDRRPAVAMSVLRHPTGLALQVPDGAYEVAQAAAGFRLSPFGSAKRRTPIEVVVELRAGGAPSGTFPESRVIGGRLFHYRIDTEEGGSSGDEKVLRAWTQAGARHVWIEEGLAVEPPAIADFTAAWQIAAGLETPQP